MKRTVLAGVAAFVSLAVVGVAPVSAHGREDAIHIRALAGPNFAPGPGTACPESAPLVANVMSGNLVGCWYTDTFNPTVTENGDGTNTLTAVGVEHFVGCIDFDHDGRCRHEEASGTWQTSYTFTGIFYDPPFVGAEISGGCTHPILPGTGTGGFRGARGTIFMTDNVNNGTSNVTGRVALRDD